MPSRQNQAPGKAAPAVAAASSRSMPGHPPARNSRMGNQAVQQGLLERTVQAKLTVNQPGDRFEQQADRMADLVMRMPDPSHVQEPGDDDQSQPPHSHGACPTCQEKIYGSPGPVQRQCAKCEEDLEHQSNVQARGLAGSAPEVSPATASRIEALQQGGEPLPAEARHFFEPRFGQDFSHVRVHTDSDSARSLQARAYTAGHHIVFGAGQYSPQTSDGKRLLAHELTHVVQQEGAVARQAIQRAGDPAAIPLGLPCPTDTTPGRPAGTDLLFATGQRGLAPAHAIPLATFLATWLAAGGTDDIIVHGYASTLGDQGPNWTLSCERAEAVRNELVRLGIPAVRIDVLAHGESTDFGGGLAANQRVVVTTQAPGPISLPVIVGLLTPRDSFTGRSGVRFGVGEVIDLSFVSFPPRPAADFGGLQWVLVAGGGVLAPGLVPADGTATYTAPAAASAVRLELRVAAGATGGRVISAHAITIVPPNGVRMTAVAGTAPGFSLGGTIPVGTWGAGFQADPFIDPKDVSFQGVRFNEGTVPEVVTPPGSFLSIWSPLTHPFSDFGFAHGGNAVTGTRISPPVDNIFSGGRAPAGTLPLFGSICGTSDFLWAIPWEFSVSGGPRTRFATANHHATSTLGCHATIEKAGAGPFCRRLDGTTC